MQCNKLGQVNLHPLLYVALPQLNIKHFIKLTEFLRCYDCGENHKDLRARLDLNSQ